MRIAFFLENNKAGGMDTFLKNLIDYWPKKNDQLIVFSNSNHPGIKFLKSHFKNKKNVKLISYKSDLMYHSNRKYNFFYKAFKYLKKINSYNKIIIYISNLFIKYKIERLFVIQGSYPGGLHGLASIIAWSKISSIKPWFNFHNYAIKRRKIDLFGKYIDISISKRIAGFISVSKSCIKSINKISNFKFLPKKYIYNGINVERKIFDKQNKKKKIKLLFLGVYEKRKGHKFLFDTLNLLNKKKKKFECNVYGDGNKSEVNSVRKIIPNEIKSKIKLNKHSANIYKVIFESDIILITSQFEESFGYSALEGMAFCKPIISTNCGGLPEVIKNNSTGFIVNKNNTKLFADKILYLINNPKFRKTMGKKGHLRYLKKFNSKDMAFKYSKLIK